MLYTADSKGPFRVPGYHDKDSTRIMGIIFQPETWSANTVYSKPDDDNYDIVIPTVFTGLYYKVKTPGKSFATEPTWVMLHGEETVDGVLGLTWQAVNYNLMPINETITAVEISCTHEVTVSGISFTTKSCQFMIDVLPAAAIAAGSFQVLIHATKSTGELMDVTLQFKIGDH